MRIRQGKDTSRPSLFLHPQDEDFTRPISVLSALDEPAKVQKKRSRRGIVTIAVGCTAVCVMVLALVLWQQGSVAPSSTAVYTTTPPPSPGNEFPTGNQQSQELSQGGAAQSEPQKEGSTVNPFVALTTSSAPAARPGRPSKSGSPARKPPAKAKEQDTDVILLEAILSPNGTPANKARGAAQKSD